MADTRNLYVADGSTVDAIEAAMQSIELPAGLDYDIEPADEYDGFTVAIDITSSGDVDQAAAELVEKLTAAIPFRVATSSTLNREAEDQRRQSGAA